MILCFLIMAIKEKEKYLTSSDVKITTNRRQFTKKVRGMRMCEIEINPISKEAFDSIKLI